MKTAKDPLARFWNQLARRPKVPIRTAQISVSKMFHTTPNGSRGHGWVSMRSPRRQPECARSVDEEAGEIDECKTRAKAVRLEGFQRFCLRTL